jgi:hypothetical protein
VEDEGVNITASSATTKGTRVAIKLETKATSLLSRSSYRPRPDLGFMFGFERFADCWKANLSDLCFPSARLRFGDGCHRHSSRLTVPNL